MQSPMDLIRKVTLHVNDQVTLHVSDQVRLNHYTITENVTRFAKTGRIYRNLFYCTIMFWALKAFFCSNIKSVLQSDSQLQAVKARDAIHSIVCI